MESSSQIYKVAIVGAGISGLSAARHLIKNGLSDSEIIILEAGDKAGGRIQTISFGRGLVELGAQWIHGEQNEFCQLVKSSGHRHVKTWWEGKGDFLCPDGKKVENEVVDEVLGWIEDKIEQVEETYSIETLAHGNNTQSHTTSMGEYLLENFLAHLKDNFPGMEKSSPEYSTRMALFQWGMSFQRIDNSCDKMNDVSLYRWSEFEVNPGEHYNNFGRGAQFFVDEVLVSDLNHCIKFNSPVTNIEWDGEVKGGDVSPVKVKVEGGPLILAETVLVTCSIAYLKSNLDSLFTPSLPQKLTKAINSTGFGPVTKIFLEWDKPWWPSDLKGIQLVWPNEYIDCCGGESDSEDLKHSWHRTITGFDPILDNSNILLGWLGGPEAVYAEGLTDNEIGTRCVEILRNFTGLHIPDVTAVVVSKWNTNPFFQGAYSFRSVEGDMTPGDICSILCEPVTVEDHNGINKPVIILAGEALSKTHYSTLHGAFESGMSQGNKILQYFTNPKKSSTKIANKQIQVQSSGDYDSKDENHAGNQGKDEEEGKGAFHLHLTPANSNSDIIKVPS